MAVAAFFDVDGTLIAKNSGPLYMKFLRRRGEIRRRDVVRTFYFYLRYRLNLLDIDRALERSSVWIRGRAEADIASHCRLWYRDMVRQYLQPEMVRRVHAHRERGDLVALLSSTTNYLAEPLAEELGIEHLLVSRLVVRDGRFTGEAVRPICYGDGKLHWARRFAAEHDVDLAASFFYTDSVTDVPMLEIVGHPQVVNPDPLLRRIARQRGWQVMQLRLDDRVALSA
ncbi:MAG: HAD family hydrolase [Deltaproteobacteria bacterium]|nr:HAD family hydrolase [Deltaproteobacteria bacterium]